MDEDSNLSQQIAFIFFQTSLYADGGVRSAQTILKHFTTVSPIIITQKDSLITQEFKDLGYKVIVRPLSREPGQSLFVNGFFLGIIELLKIVTNNFWFLWFLIRTKIEVVHCNDVLSFLYFGFGAALKRAKIIFVLRRSFETARSYSAKYKYAFRLSDTVVTLSESMKTELIERLSPKQRIGCKITSIYSGVDRELSYIVDEEEKASLRHSLNFDDSFYIAYIGSFSPRKGQFEFLENTCLPLAKENSNIRFKFVGDFHPQSNGYCAKCAKFVQDHHLEHCVTFVGGVADVTVWYRVCDLVVLASSSEGLARVMIEALCIGTPVVSFDVSSAREILEKHECGLVVEQGNYPELVDAIERIVKDEEFRKRLRHNALRVAADLFDANRCAQQFEDLYIV